MKFAENENKFLLLWLITGCVLLFFSFFNYAIPAAAWFAPVFLMRFTRGCKSAVPLVFGAAMIWITYFLICFPSVRMMNSVVIIILISCLAFIYYGALMFDRHTSRKTVGILSTLFFPLIWAAIEYCRSFIPGSGSYGSLAYSQFGDLPLMQTASITGIWGITFLICWFGPVVNLVWEKGFVNKKTRFAVYIFIGVIALVYIMGGTRLALFPPKGKFIRIAAVTKDGIGSEFVNIYRDKKFRSLEDYKRDIVYYSSKASMMGADIVLWQEYEFQVPESNETALIGILCDAARTDKTYHVFGAVIYKNDINGKGENKSFLADPNGKLIWTYVKHNLVEGLETRLMRPGGAKLPFAETPLGLWTSAICFDNDFPGYIRQAGIKGADILLNPSLDWPEIVPYHSRMAVFRAVENGFSTVRATGNGLSIASDWEGRVLASKNELRTPERMMIADVPAKGARTIYSKTGDLFAWLCIAGFIVLLCMISVDKNREKDSRSV